MKQKLGTLWTGWVISTVLWMAVCRAVAGDRSFPAGENPPGCTLFEQDPEEFLGRPTQGVSRKMKRQILRWKLKNGAPRLPDLDVTYIERTPRFPKYKVNYQPRGLNPSLSEREKKVQRWPHEGQAVTFHAHIANKGLSPSPVSDWLVYMDGTPLPGALGKIPPIAPNEEVVVHAPWLWQPGRHKVTVFVDTEDQVEEITEKNNRVSNWTDAYTFLWVCHEKLHVAQDCVKNRYGSYSSEDWHRSVMQWMNWSFSECRYPSTPNGIPARVRIDYYTVHPNPKSLYRSHPLWRFHDGCWNHSPEMGVDSRGKTQGITDSEQENRARAYAQRNAVFEAFRSGLDWALVHELGHQLGLIDLYHMSIEPEQCLVRTASGKLLSDVYPQKAQHRGRVSGIMMGTQHVSLRWSEHSANALCRDYCRRRGFYGDYLFDLPEQSLVKIVGRDGRPIPGAEVRVYQREGPVVPNRVKHRGKADENGLFDLGSDPFGNVHIVGLNGVLLFRVQHPIKRTVDWAWLEIAVFNMAYWYGYQERAVIPLRTYL